MSRLPNPGGDDGQWGDILNAFLLTAHAADGTIKSGVVDTTHIANGAVTTPKLGTTGTPTSGQVLSYNGSSLSWTTPTGSGSVPDADGSTKGLVQLTGDLGGTAASPTVPGLTAKAADNAVVHLSGSETITGTKNFTGTLQAGGQTVVVTNDSRLSDQRTPSNSSVTYAKLSASGATSGQVLSYDGSGLAWTTPSGGASDATTSSKGIVQLAGDLGGTAASPTVPGLAAKATDTAVVHNTGTETVAGVKTFSSSPIVPTPTTNTQAANKSYVDSVAAAGAADATTSSKGIVQLAGDLGGTAASPTVAKVNGVTVSGTPTSGQVLTASSGTAASWATPSGGSSLTVVSKTGNYTANSREYVIGDASSAGFTVTLPAVANGAWVTVKKVDSSGNGILVMPQGGVQIDNSNSVSVNVQFMAADFISDGTKWWRVG